MTDDTLKSDEVYSSFFLNTEEYAIIRKIGRISISIGRRLGEIYDIIPRIIASTVFELDEREITPILGKKLKIDTCLRFSLLKQSDITRIKKYIKSLIGKEPENGLGIEIRYNFNPNDSSRLRKDDDMAALIRKDKLLPIYLVFSSISPREEAIERLKRAGWYFQIGKNAYNFMNNLYGIDMRNLFRLPLIRKGIEAKISILMKKLFSSKPFIEMYKKYN